MVVITYDFRHRRSVLRLYKSHKFCTDVTLWRLYTKNTAANDKQSIGFFFVTFALCVALSLLCEIDINTKTNIT